MEVYEFEKCIQLRLEESENVLASGVPASGVRNEWAHFIELQLEPTGWEALWKIPRVICEELSIRYPTVVRGTVEQVIFRQLKAEFTVTGVEDDNIHIPERQIVSLEELWPTKTQMNKELNIERTAECIDQLRFFYNNVWMPWDNDNDDDIDWAQKYLTSRIHFYYDLKKGNITRSVAAHIKTLLTEARYIQKRREYLEMDLTDDEDDEDKKNEKLTAGKNNAMYKSCVTDLMRLHLRLQIIRSEIEMLENPELRMMYEEIKFSNDKYQKSTTIHSRRSDPGPIHMNLKNFIVTRPCNLPEQMKLLERAKSILGKEKIVQMSPTLQDALNMCNSSDNIFLPPGRHSIKFLEYLNNNGKITGLVESNSRDKKDTFDRLPCKDVIIMSVDDDSILLVFDGDFTLENITLDCRNIRSGILIKNGTIHIKNCRIIGEAGMSTNQGLICTGNSKLILENCLIENFSAGLVLNDESECVLENSTIDKCKTGIEIQDGTNLIFKQQCVISQFSHHGIRFETNFLSNNIEKNHLTLSKFTDLDGIFSGNQPWTGICRFENGIDSNIFVVNKRNSDFYPFLKQNGTSNSLENLNEVTPFTEGSIEWEDDEDKDEDVSMTEEIIILEDSLINVTD